MSVYNLATATLETRFIIILKIINFSTDQVRQLNCCIILTLEEIEMKWVVIKFL